MNVLTIKQALTGLPIGDIRFFDTVGSTNDEAMRWMQTNPPNLSLVLADEQTQGRGRTGRRWLTPRGAALAVSVILHPAQISLDTLPLINGVGALAVSEGLRHLGLAPMIKWPNDVLLNGLKVAGILPESQWMGEQLRGVVLGIGINILRASVPPAETVHFPAGCVEDALGRPIARETVLREVIVALLEWLGHLGTPWLVHSWENQLAFRGEMVRVVPPVGDAVEGLLSGLTIEGNLRLRVDGEVQVFTAGEIHLRPSHSPLSNQLS
ncbi:MAG: biotin--[acetyl-CoA-carboxylase] ligase [Anaerolineales bacterium]